MKEFVDDKSKESSFTVEFEEPSFKPSEGDSSHIVFEREDQDHDNVPGDSKVQSEEIGSSNNDATTDGEFVVLRTYMYVLGLMYCMYCMSMSTILLYGAFLCA